MKISEFGFDRKSPKANGKGIIQYSSGKLSN